MHDDDRAIDFDNIIDERAVNFDKIVGKQRADDKRDAWRLGHRRPWWQWNVITLFVALFALVWVRELARLSQTASWTMCVGMLALWAFGPLLALEPPEDPWAKKSSKADSATDVARLFAFMAALAMFAGVFLLGGLTVCILAFFGALLFAAGSRGR